MDRNCRIWNKCKLLPIGGDARVLEASANCVELIVEVVITYLLFSVVNSSAPASGRSQKGGLPQWNPGEQ